MHTNIAKFCVLHSYFLILPVQHTNALVYFRSMEFELKLKGCTKHWHSWQWHLYHIRAYKNLASTIWQVICHSLYSLLNHKRQHLMSECNTSSLSYIASDRVNPVWSSSYTMEKKSAIALGVIALLLIAALTCVALVYYQSEMVSCILNFTNHELNSIHQLSQSNN